MKAPKTLRMTEAELAEGVQPESGSFRDPSGQVYIVGGRVIRGVNETTASELAQLLEEGFFKKAISSGEVVRTQEIEAPEVPVSSSFSDQPWARFFDHQPISMVTYPYEWTFSMLQDAAALQLKLVEVSLENGWTLKDATPYNIQFEGSKPVFIDVASFQPWVEGEPWVGYRQFCAMFLAPLMLRNYLGVDHAQFLRSSLEGVSSIDAAKLLRGTARFRRGVLSHIVFPASVERSILKRERDDVPAKRRDARTHSRAMVIGLVQSLRRLVSRFDARIAHTDWSEYDTTHTYAEPDFEKKKAFVERHAAQKKRHSIWDIGCNTGTFSRICAPFAEQVLAIDGDHDAVEKLYLAERDNRDSNILPLVMDLANMSPGQGWAGQERKAFTDRGKPDLIVCLALIHHIRISANIPISKYLDWLASLGCDVVIEFVDRHDEMVIKLLTNKKEQYGDYSRTTFEHSLARHFSVKESEELKEGRRVIYMLSPLGQG